MLGFFIVALIVIVLIYSIGIFDAIAFAVEFLSPEYVVERYGSIFVYAFDLASGYLYVIIGLIVATIILVIGFIAYLCFSNIELTVTDKRVYGKINFGRRVDLPIDKISAVAFSWPKAISIATSSGKITFAEIINRDEIYECINNLLIERQNKTNIQEIKQEISQTSDAEELKKYKDLLNEGIITQEEFEAKKKQILGI